VTHGALFWCVIYPHLAPLATKKLRKKKKGRLCAPVRSNPARQYRIDQALAERAEELAEVTGYGSANRVIEQCVKDIFAMCEAPPDRRMTPIFVSVVDGVRNRGLLRPGSAYRSRAGGVVSAVPSRGEIHSGQDALNETHE
jgi:hypothetical protein